MHSKILPHYKNLKNMIFIWGSHFSNHNLNLFTIGGNNCVEWCGRLYSYSEERLVPHLPLTSGFVICLMPANFGLFQTKTFSVNQHLIPLPHMGTCNVPDEVVQSQWVLGGRRGMKRMRASHSLWHTKDRSGNQIVRVHCSHLLLQHYLPSWFQNMPRSPPSAHLGADIRFLMLELYILFAALLD